MPCLDLRTWISVDGVGIAPGIQGSQVPGIYGVGILRGRFLLNFNLFLRLCVHLRLLGRICIVAESLCVFWCVFRCVFLFVFRSVFPCVFVRVSPVVVDIVAVRRIACVDRLDAGGD